MFLEIKPKNLATGAVSADYDEKVYSMGRLGGPITRRERQVFRWVLEELGNGNSKHFDGSRRLLDNACGSGKFVAYASHYMSVVGLDISSLAIKQARQRVAQGTLCVGESEKLPFADNSFDYISCFGSLEHFQDMEQGLLEMKRCLRTGGRLFLLVPNLYGFNNALKAWMLNKTPTTAQIVERLACADAWKDLIERAGFKVLSVSGLSFHREVRSLHPFGIITPLLNMLSNLCAMVIPKSMHSVFCFLAKIRD